MPDPIRPWLIEVRQLTGEGQGSLVVRYVPGIEAATAEGALATARSREANRLRPDQWLTIGLPGSRPVGGGR